MKSIFTGFINLYKKIFSRPLAIFLENLGLIKGNSCVFYPTCSEYTRQAMQKYGLPKGVFLGFFRILRCHPWQKNHIDPVK